MRVHNQKLGVRYILEIVFSVGDVFLRNVDAGHTFDTGRDLPHDPAISGGNFKDAVTLFQMAPHEVYLPFQIFGDRRQLRLVYLAQPLRMQVFCVIIYLRHFVSLPPKSCFLIAALLSAASFTVTGAI